MAFHVFLFLFIVCLLLSLTLLCRLCWLHRQPSHSKPGAVRASVQRLLKPRTPLDCPACRLSCDNSTGVGLAPAPVRPWREVKSRRGAPKRVNTDGFACSNRTCLYFGIADARVHALVGDGTHGRAERIQTFRGPACHTTFTSRRDTPLYRLKTPSHKIAVVLSALAEGLDPSAAERVFGYRQATITSWLSRAARARIHSARALLLPPPPPAPAVRRAAHPAPLRQRGALALAGHRPHDEAASRPPSGSPYARRRASRHPLPATHPGPWMSPTFHQ